MRLTVPAIDCSEGFTQENDLFNREQFAANLEKLIEISEDDNLVIAINDKWGNGKTTFLKMWESKIQKEQKFNVIYFDAFKNDFQSDPFIAISSHIYSIIDDPKLQSKYLDITKRVASILMKTTLKIGISALTLGAVKGTEFEGIGDDIKDGLNDPLQKFIEEKVTQLERETETIEHLRSTLNEIAHDKKLIFIIDELDRARPNYCLELLERIKHVFNTENIFFILSVDKEQFQSVIKQNYGDIDANIYLNKFVHLWLTLPKADNKQMQAYSLEKYINYVNNKILKRQINLRTSLTNLSYLLRVNNLSLRDAERCYSILLILNTKMDNGYRWEYEVGAAIVSFLKVKNESLIKKHLSGALTKEQLRIEMNLKKESSEDDEFHLHCALNTEFMTHDEFKAAYREDYLYFFRETRQLKVIDYFCQMLDNFEF